MEITKRLGLLFTFLTSLSAFSQVELGLPTPEEKDADYSYTRETNSKEPRIPNGDLDLVFEAQTMSTFRTLKVNEGLFADSIGLRSEEDRNTFTSFKIGFNAPINKSFQFEGGLSFVRNGENYAFDGGDTTFNYVNTYRYIGMPLGVNFKRGEDFQFIAGAGIMPGLFISYTQDQTWISKTNTPGDSIVKIRSGNSDFNSIVLSGYVQAGVQLKLSQNYSVFVLPRYRLQFTNSYGRFNGLIHNANAWGVSYGLTVHF